MKKWNALPAVTIDLNDKIILPNTHGDNSNKRELGKGKHGRVGTAKIPKSYKSNKS